MLVPRRVGTAKLSVIARDSRGTEHLYVLRLVTGETSPDIIAIADPTGRTGLGLAPVSTLVSTEQLSAGVDVAIQRQILTQDSPLWQAVTQFIEWVEAGVSPQEAATKTGLQFPVIQKLLQLGQQTEPNLTPVPLPPDEEQLLVKDSEVELNIDLDPLPVSEPPLAPPQVNPPEDEPIAVATPDEVDPKALRQQQKQNAKVRRRWLKAQRKQTKRDLRWLRKWIKRAHKEPEAGIFTLRSLRTGTS